MVLAVLANRVLFPLLLWIHNYHFELLLLLLVSITFLSLVRIMLHIILHSLKKREKAKGAFSLSSSGGIRPMESIRCWPLKLAWSSVLCWGCGRPMQYYGSKSSSDLRLECRLRNRTNRCCSKYVCFSTNAVAWEGPPIARPVVVK